MAVDPVGIGRLTHLFNNGDVSFGCGEDLFFPSWVGLAADASAFCAASATAFSETVLPLLSIGIAYVGDRLLVSDGTVELEGTSSVDSPGLASGDMAPINCAVCIHRGTGESYRGGKGRTYIGAIPQSAQVSERAWSDEYVADMLTAYQAYLDAVHDIGSGGFTDPALEGVTHRIVAGAPVTPNFAPLVSIKVNKRICTQRRRLGPLLG